MATVNRRANRDRLSKGTVGAPRKESNGTVTGGPLVPIDLMEVLSRASPAASGGGAVSGAAHQVRIASAGPGAHERGIALSDGSRISFASVHEVVAFQDESQLSDA